MQAIYVNSDNTIEWDLAALESDDSYVNSGTGTWTLKTAAGVTLATGSLSYVTSSNGKWQGTVDQDDTATLTVGTAYWMELDLANGSGAEEFRRFQVIALYKGAS